MDRRHLEKRVLALLFGVALTFVLLEAGLWIASLLFKPPDRAALLAPAPGERRIVCIGDSNTYGIYLKPEQSYPAQLQGFLDRVPGNPWRVINLGFPGQNSAQVRGRLAENLALYRAEILIVLVGVNNSWSPAMSHLWRYEDREPSPTLVAGLVQKCRTVGLARMAWGRLLDWLQPGWAEREGARVIPGLRGALRGEGAGEIDPVDYRKSRITSLDDPRRSLAVDFRRILRICTEHGTKLVLVTYPIEVPFVLNSVNPSIRGFAEGSGTALADLERTFLPLLSRLGREKLQFPDGHATAIGNYEVARLVLATLVSAGLVEARGEWTNVAPLETRLRACELRALGTGARQADLSLAGEPGSHFQLALELVALDDAGRKFSAQRIHLRDDPSLGVEERRAYFGELDERGEERRRITLPDLPAAEGSRARWRLTARFVPPANGVGREVESRSVEIRPDQERDR